MASRSTCVVIIGAGAAGVAAACRLIESGIYDVLILEAESRMGGRIHTTKFGNDGVVDLGAQWVHGEKGNVVSSMAQRLGLLGDTITDRTNMPFVNSTGQLLCTKTTGKILNLLMNIMKSSEQTLKMFKGSLGEYFDKEFQNLLSRGNLTMEEMDCAKHILKWYEKFENSYDGSDSWYYTSGRGHTEYQECEGNIRQSWKSGGYHKMFDILTNKYPDSRKKLPVESKILFNKDVVNIEWDHVNGDKVKVKCRDNSNYIATNVIVTVSLGVLKETAATLFTPPLPQQNVIAIQGLSIGTVDKIFLRFPHQWWPKETRGFSFLWTDDDIVKFNKVHGTDNNKNWLTDVYGFYMVDRQPNVLCGWVVGPSARTMEKLNDDDVTKSCMGLLNRYLGLKFKIPHPVEMTRSTWSLNPHFRGAYSFRSMDTEAMNTSASHLAEPLTNSRGKQTVLFAGEATHSHFFSTVHGAVESGWREADRVVKLLGAPVTSRL